MSSILVAILALLCTANAVDAAPITYTQSGYLTSVAGAPPFTTGDSFWLSLTLDPDLAVQSAHQDNQASASYTFHEAVLQFGIGNALFDTALQSVDVVRGGGRNWFTIVGAPGSAVGGELSITQVFSQLPAYVEGREPVFTSNALVFPTDLSLFTGDGRPFLYLDAIDGLGGHSANARGYITAISLRTVPEPSTLVLIGTGLGGLLLRRRAKAKSRRSAAWE